MKSVTLSASGLKFSTSFNTTVRSVSNPQENSTIVLDSMPNVEISLGSTSAESLGLEVGSQVTIKPVKGSATNEFKLEVGAKAKPKAAAPAPTSKSGCASYERFSNDL
jgi:molybdopterin-binding protein